MSGPQTKYDRFHFCRLEHSRKRSRSSYCWHLSSFCYCTSHLAHLVCGVGLARLRCRHRVVAEWRNPIAFGCATGKQRSSARTARVWRRSGAGSCWLLHPFYFLSNPLLAAMALLRFYIRISTSFAKFHSERAEPPLPSCARQCLAHACQPRR